MPPLNRFYIRRAAIFIINKSDIVRRVRDIFLFALVKAHFVATAVGSFKVGPKMWFFVILKSYPKPIEW